jgi:photosystem II stability/assembly factor-like uncharacterized protein
MRDGAARTPGTPGTPRTLGALLAVVLALGAQACAAPSPATPAARSPATPTSTPAATGPAHTAAPTPTPVTTPSPSPEPPIAAAWDIVINPGEPDVPVDLHVVDRAGTMIGVRDTVRPISGPLHEAPYALEIGPGSDRRSITVGWTGSVCDERGVLELAADGRTLALRFPQRAGCDAMGVGFSLELRFAVLVGPADFHGTWSQDLVAVRDLSRPVAVAFTDPLHGWVGGTTDKGDAIVLETVDGGASWRVGGLALGEVTDIAAIGDGGAIAGLACFEGGDCRSGRYRYEGDGLWGRAALEVPLRLSFEGPAAAGLFGAAAPSLSLSGDGGESWRSVASPCRATGHLAAAARVDRSTIVVVCESQGAGGGSKKELFRSSDNAATWGRPVAGPEPGTGTGLDILADGTGWLWGDRSPLWTTDDGGETWSALDVADGDVRMVEDADAWGPGAGVVLVSDPDRQATLLLRTDDGRAWTELFAWPSGVTCCG